MVFCSKCVHNIFVICHSSHTTPPPPPDGPPKGPSRGVGARGKERGKRRSGKGGSPLRRVCSRASLSDNVRHAPLLPHEDFELQRHRCGAAGLESLRRNRSHRIRPRRRRPRRRRRRRGRLGGPGWEQVSYRLPRRGCHGRCRPGGYDRAWTRHPNRT